MSTGSLGVVLFIHPGGVTMQANYQQKPNGSQPVFMTTSGIDKIEALWFNRVIGTEQMSHPVALKRANNFLEEICKKAESCIFLKKQAW
jgi:hypothetical protein